MPQGSQPPTTHTVFRAPAKGCGPFSKVGEFGLAAYIPMLHSAALDSEGQRLFVTLASGKSSAAVGVIDISAAGGGNMTASIAEGAAPDTRDTLLSLHYDAAADRVFGLWVPQSQTQQLALHSLDPGVPGGSAPPAWEPQIVVTGVPGWNAVGGNSAVVSAYRQGKGGCPSCSGGSLFFMAGKHDPDGNTAYDLAEVAVAWSAGTAATAAVVANPPVGPLGLCASTGADGGDCLEALVFSS